MKRNTRKALKALELTDEDLDRLADIRPEDKALMLAFAQRYGSKRLNQLLNARKEQADGDAAADNAR